jgi:hypothetical protein
MAMPEIFPHIKATGRKSISEHARMKSTLKRLFNTGVSAASAVEYCRRLVPPVSVSEQTVRKYFRLWVEKIETEKSESIIDRDIETKNRFERSHDELILKAYGKLTEVEAYVAEQKNMSNNIISPTEGKHKQIESWIRLIAELQEKKMNVLLAPTITDAMLKEVDDFVLKERERRLSEI